jgi:hypothetical protein
VGNWGIDQLLQFLPGVFTIEERLPYKKDPRSVKQKPEKVVGLTPEAVAYAENNIAELIRRNPVWLPTPRLPARWEDWKKGGTSDHRLAGSLTIVSNRNKDSARAVRKAIRDGAMKPTLDALNACSAVDNQQAGASCPSCVCPSKRGGRRRPPRRSRRSRHV